MTIAISTLRARASARAIASGELKPEKLVRALLEEAKRKSHLNAFIALAEEQAIAAAERVRPTAHGPPLLGVPFAVKDNIIVAGLPATAGTPGLANFKPRTNAPVVQKLVDAGAIVLGKANMHELSFGITSNNAAFGAVGNAIDPSCFAGGSSGGSAVAVAANMVSFALGTDTGGSMRIPASLNGIVGFRPTSGRYPCAGIAPLSHTNDTPGPMARSVDDVVLIDGVITDTALELEPASLAGLRLGLPAPFVHNIDPMTSEVFEAAKAKLQAAGAVLVPVDLAEVADLDAKTGFPIVLWEARRDLAAFLRESGTGVTMEQLTSAIASADVKATFEGSIIDSAPEAMPDEVYRAALDEFRPQLQRSYLRVFQEHGLAALLFPTTPLPAQPIQGSDETVMLNGTLVPTFQTFVRNTHPGATAGLPGLSLNGGATPDGRKLPVGIEVDGPSGSDRTLLAIGLAIEQLLSSNSRL